MDRKFEIDLSITSLGVVERFDYHIAILPWGATEPHNRHLPYLTDAILSHEISCAAALQALEVGVRAMVLPAMTLGSQNPGQWEQPFCIHARYDTQRAILTDYVASLRRQGIDKLIIVSGHGGNNFKNMIRDMAFDYPDFMIAATDWFSIVPAASYFEQTGDHADELETSVMLHFHPELVDMSTAGPGLWRPFAIRSLREREAWIPRNWAEVSEDTGIGDPRKATASKGARYAAVVTDRLCELIVSLVNEELY